MVCGTSLASSTGHGDYLGITSTVSGNGDTGADPNKLVVVVDKLSNTDPSFATQTPFFDVKDAQFGEVLRGVSFTPGTDFGILR